MTVSPPTGIMNALSLDYGWLPILVLTQCVRPVLLYLRDCFSDCLTSYWGPTFLLHHGWHRDRSGIETGPVHCACITDGPCTDMGAV